VQEADLEAVHFGDEHTLSGREGSDEVAAALDVRVEDALRVSAVVAAVEGA